jgi:cactin
MEDRFHMKQDLERAHIRISEARAQPVDRILKNFLPTVELGVETEEPHELLREFDDRDLDSLLRKIPDFLKGDEENADFWELLQIVAKDEEAQREAASASRGGRGHRRTGLHDSVSADADRLLESKSLSEIEDLCNDAKNKISHGEGDVHFWEQLIARARVFSAKLRLSELHEEILKRRLAQIEEEGLGEEAERKISERAAKIAEHRAEVERKKEEKRLEELTEAATYRPTSRAIQLADEPDVDDLLRLEASKGMGQNEYKFDDVVDVSNDKVEWWHDKYRPRKPKYFNRVRTGVEWHKYNRAHYDYDTPPPKIVFGYRFNIFYPDLIDKSVAPTYSVHNSDDPDIAIVRFHAGPPYEVRAAPAVDIGLKHNALEYIIG